MGLFSKRIPARQRVETVSPLLKTLLPYLTKYDQAVFDDSWEGQIAAIESIGTDLVATVNLIKSTPSPSSSNSRQHKKDFKWTLQRYIKAMVQGERVINTLESGLGAKTQWGGMSDGMATRRVNQLVSSYRMSVSCRRATGPGERRGFWREPKRYIKGALVRAIMAGPHALNRKRAMRNL